MITFNDANDLIARQIAYDGASDAQTRLIQRVTYHSAETKKVVDYPPLSLER